MSSSAPLVGLFVTCLVDLFRPSVGFAAVRLLEAAGCRVDVPMGQSCCGQPAYNSGDRADARAVAATLLDAFGPHDYVVVPSGSCAGMISRHLPGLFAGEARHAKAEALAAKTHELVSFLTDIRGVDRVESTFRGSVTYHDSCSGLRELGIKAQPRRLLDSIPGLRRAELPSAEICCGFGGTFCVKYPEISNRMVDDKAVDVEATGAGTLLAGDLGCLLNMAGKLTRRGSTVAVRHVAEILAGDPETPPIGAPAEPVRR